MKRYSVGNKIAHNILKSGRFGSVLGLTGYYMTAPGYFAGNVDYTGFFLHHCVHYMDLVSFLVSPVTGLTARKVEKTPGRVLFHVALDFDCGAIGTIAMGTIQSRGTPVERIEIMAITSAWRSRMWWKCAGTAIRPSRRRTRRQRSRIIGTA